MATVILAINNMNIFGRNQLLSADRRVKLQNDLSRCLEHLSKQAAMTIGNQTLFGADTAVYITSGALALFIDANANGTRDTDGTDYWVRYKLDSSTHNFNYCGKCPDAACATCVITEDTLSTKLTEFSVTSDFTKGNYLDVKVTACWDPATCPDADKVTMYNTVSLPSLSTN